MKIYSKNSVLKELSPQGLCFLGVFSKALRIFAELHSTVFLL